VFYFQAAELLPCSKRPKQWLKFLCWRDIGIDLILQLKLLAKTLKEKRIAGNNESG
jgi:hypothetical protein